MEDMTVEAPARRRLLANQGMAPEDVVVWNWPLRDEGLRSWALLLVVSALVALVWTLWRDVAFTLLAAATFAISLWRMLLPVKWSLGLTGLKQTVLGMERRIPWMAIARFEFQPHGVWLYSHRAGSPQRGIYIAYGDQPQRVRTIVDYYLGTWTSAGDSTRSFH